MPRKGLKLHQQAFRSSRRWFFPRRFCLDARYWSLVVPLSPVGISTIRKQSPGRYDPFGFTSPTPRVRLPLPEGSGACMTCLSSTTRNPSQIEGCEGSSFVRTIQTSAMIIRLPVCGNRDRSEGQRGL
ncbi:unnamed protein product [Scytosiphon promiscuus]